ACTGSGGPGSGGRTGARAAGSRRGTDRGTPPRSGAAAAVPSLQQALVPQGVMVPVVEALGLEQLEPATRGGRQADQRVRGGGGEPEGVAPRRALHRVPERRDLAGSDPQRLGGARRPADGGRDRSRAG